MDCFEDEEKLMVSHLCSYSRACLSVSLENFRSMDSQDHTKARYMQYVIQCTVCCGFYQKSVDAYDLWESRCKHKSVEVSSCLYIIKYIDQLYSRICRSEFVMVISNSDGNSVQ